MTQSSDPSIPMLAALIHERTGLYYAENRLDLLADKIRPLLGGSFGSFMDYYYFLKYDPNGDQEWQRLQTALAVNESYFWREVDQIQTVAEVIVPRLQQAHPGRSVRIWHAACATGEEPYTMAIALTEAGRFLHGPIEILATDFNNDALNAARKGVFRQRSFRGLPPEIMDRYFRPTQDGRTQIDSAIRARVDFHYANLLDPSNIPSNPPFDVIFCRNAFIYFSEASIRQVIGQFHKVLTPSGYLFVAAAESLLRITNAFHLVEIGSAFGYQKQDSGNGEAHGAIIG
jgi:chemotaxis protein methyltransferase CheR